MPIRTLPWRALSGARAALVAALLVATACASAPPAADPSAARAELARRGFRAATVAGPLGEVRYLVAGRGPLLVLVHGSGRQASDWAAIAPPLGRRFTVVLLDLPGHGESGPAAGALPVGELAASLGAVLDADFPGQRATLVGNSLGGWVALLYALRQPQRVERVIGLSSSGIFAKLEVPLMPKDRAEARTLWRALHGPDHPPLDDAGLDALVTRVAAGPAPRLFAGLRAEDFLDARGGEITTPVDLLWGEQDGVLPLAYAERLAALVHARLHRLPGCAHIPQVDCPRQTLRALEAILASPLR